MKTPVLIIIFNRPDTTRRLIDALRSIKPSKIFIAADGPRTNKHGEDGLCKKTRTEALSIDWPCKIETLFRGENLGCKLAVSSAITWFFENVDEGIILEDDCIPNRSFFTFCELMLNKYRNNSDIMHINGTNFQFGVIRGNSSYYFSRCAQVWGWATWRRAWNKYDITMNDLDDFISNKQTDNLFHNKEISKYWNSLFKHIKKHNINTWDAQWVYSIMKNGGLTICPNINLIENIGFDSKSTHTKEIDTNTKQKTEEFKEIINPQTISPDIEADIYLYKIMYKKTIYAKIKNKILSIFNKHFKK